MSLQRYLTLLIWLCLLPLLALGLALAVEHVNDIHRDSAEVAQRLALNGAALVDRSLQARQGALQVLAASPAARAGDRLEDLRGQALAYAQALGSHVGLVDLGGQLVMSSHIPAGQPLPALDMTDGQAALDQARRSGKPAVGDLFPSPVSGQPMVALAAPVLRQGEVAALLLTGLPATMMAERLAQLSPPPGWHLALLDSHGHLIAQAGETPARGDHRRFEARTQLAPWTLRVSIPGTLYLAPTLSAAGALALALLLMTGVGLAGGALAARRLARSIDRLTDEPEAGTPPIREVEAARARWQKASIQLQVSEARLRGIFDTANEGIITVDRAQRIVMVNAAAAQMYGWRAEDLLGRDLAVLIPERFRAAHGAQLRAFGLNEVDVRSMGHPRPHVMGRRANGEEFPVQAAISHVHVDGQQLFTVIMRDVSEQLRVRAELEASHAALQRLVAAQDAVQEHERKRIARELHDDLQQTLAAIKMDADAVRHELPREPQRIPALLDRIDELATGAIVSTRRIVNDLRPQMLEDLGLPAALQGLARDFTQRHGLACALHAGEPATAAAENLSPALATCLFRVAQESLNNVAKHAQARRVDIELSLPAPRRLRLVVRDDGRGLAQGDRAKKQSFGLLGMGERVRAAGGTLGLEPAPGGGTRLQVDLPLDAPNDGAAAGLPDLGQAATGR